MNGHDGNMFFAMSIVFTIRGRCGEGCRAIGMHLLPKWEIVRTCHNLLFNFTSSTIYRITMFFVFLMAIITGFDWLRRENLALSISLLMQSVSLVFETDISYCVFHAFLRFLFIFLFISYFSMDENKRGLLSMEHCSCSVDVGTFYRIWFSKSTCSRVISHYAWTAAVTIEWIMKSTQQTSK